MSREAVPKPLVHIGAMGVLANGSKAVLRIGNSTVTANPTGLAVANGGQIVLIGGNVVSGNGVNGTFTSTIAQQ